MDTNFFQNFSKFIQKFSKNNFISFPYRNFLKTLTKIFKKFIKNLIGFISIYSDFS